MAANCSSDGSFGPVFSCPQHATTLDFTLTFEQSILSIAPCAILLILLPLQLRKIWRWIPKTFPSKTLAGKTAISIALVGLHIALLVLWSRLSRSDGSLRTAIPYAAVTLVAGVAISALAVLEHDRSWRPSSLVSIFLGISALFDIVQVRTLFLRGPSIAIASVLSAQLALKLALLGLQARNKRSYLKEPYSQFPPETLSGILNRCLFWWLHPTFLQGYRARLTLSSICDIDIELQSAPTQSRILHAWTRHCNKGRFALAFALASALRRPLLAVVLPRLCLVAFNYAQPFLIQRAVSLLEEEVNEETTNYGYGLIGATALVYLGIAHKLYRSLTMVRAATISLIYVTSLESPPGTLDDAKTVTLMSTDVERTVSGLELLHETWARLLEMAIGIWLLANQMGAISVAPVIVAAVCFAWQTWLAGYMGPRQLPWIKAIQSRVGNTSSVLRNMKAVRMMGLANLVEEMLQTQRLRELHLSKPFRWMIVWVNMVASMPQVLAPLVTFAAYAIRSRVDDSAQLSVVMAFSSLAIVSLITSPAVHLLSSIPALRAAEGCVDRIQEFLHSRKIGREDEFSSRESSRNGSTEGPYQHEMAILREGPRRDENRHLIKLESVNLRPAKDAELLLKNASFDIPEAKLTIAIGPVGSGKSTFLKALIGEVTPEQGSLAIGTLSVAYCSQTPWLPNGSFRDVLCGPAEYKEPWYDTVLEACDLKRAIQQLPQGDQTIIGSRGAILSGGQRQRLALARAVYARKKLLLLDDIFSALDQETEKKVANRLFSDQGLIHKLQCTTVLVTHSMRHASMADSILVFDPETKTAKARTKSELMTLSSLPPNLESSEDNQKEDDAATSTQKDTSRTAKNAVKGATQEDFEDLARRTGDVSVYLYYYRAIGLPRTLGACLILAVFTFASNFPRFWLEWYTGDPVSRFSVFLGVYFMLVVVASLSQGAMIWQIMISIVPKSGAELHRVLLRIIMHAPMQFFSDTDSGVTLNRFSQDMTLVDAVLPTVTFGTVLALMQCAAQLVFVCLGSRYMAICLPVAVVILCLIQNFYLRTSRQLRFLDLEAKSPLFTHFVETIEGLPSIRAFHWQANFTEANLKHLDQSQKPYYLLFCIQRWLILVLDLMVAAMATILVALAFSLRSTTSGGSLGAALTAILSFSQSLQDLMLSWTQMETSLGAIARTKNLEDAVPPEDANDGKVQEPHSSWPSNGSIEFQHVYVSYDDNMVLRDVSLCVKPGYKVGILGRTGSGKSTLISALLRLVDIASPEHTTTDDSTAGRILIDGTPITTISRTGLRSRILSIPQEGLALSGTIRFNANPFHATISRESESGSIDNKSYDELIISALLKVGLWQAIEARGGLDGDMTSQPLSQGEGQLFAIARVIIQKDIAGAQESLDTGAILDTSRNGNMAVISANDGTQETKPTARHSILVLDEATSNLDAETDARIQTLIRNEFRGFTIVTVAHRVDSIKDSDMIGVMEDGRLVRLGPPTEILGGS